MRGSQPGQAICAEASAFGVMHVDDHGRILEFLEKPADPPGMPGDPDRTLASMGIYLLMALRRPDVWPRGDLALAKGTRIRPQELGLLASMGQARVPVQEFVVRNDMGCGSTIGPLTAARIGVDTVDVGVPSLAMHSIRETAACKDCWSLYQVLRTFFSSDRN